MNSFHKLTRLRLPTQLPFSSAASLLSKWNHREVSLVVGSAFLIVLFLSSVYYYRRKPMSRPPEKLPEAPEKISEAKPASSSNPSALTPSEVSKDLEKSILSKPLPNQQKSEVQEQTNDNLPSVSQISSDSSSATKKVGDVADEFFSPVNDPAPKQKKEKSTPPTVPASSPKKNKASPKKVTVLEGLVSGDHTDPKFIVHYDGCEAWMKISKKGNQITLEGLYRRSKKKSGVEIAEVVVADDPHVTPMQKFFLYDYAMYIIYKYAYSFPVTPTFSLKLDSKPHIQANSIEEAALYSHFSFAPRSVKGRMKVLRDACTEEIAQKITVLDRKWDQKKPGISAAVEIKRKLGLDLVSFIAEEQSYIQESSLLEDTSELWLQYWSLLRKESYPQIVEYLNKEEPPQDYVRTTNLLKSITWFDKESARKYTASWNSRVGWSTEHIEWPQDEGTLRVATETHPDKKQIKMVGLEIQDEDQKWQPIATHPDLSPEVKFKLYRDVVAELHAIEKGRLPTFKAHNEQELHIFYHLGFLPRKFVDALKDRPLLMRVRSVFAENKAFPLELIPFRKDYFQNWVKFQNPEFEGKEFGEVLLSDYNKIVILSLSPVITFQEQKDDLYTCTVCCNDSAGKPITVQMELRCVRKTDPCVIIEKVAGLNIKDVDSSAQILSSILYVAIQKSFEWDLKGAVKVRFVSKENSMFFQLVQFHSPEITGQHIKKGGIKPFFNENGTPTKKGEQFIKNALEVKVDPNILLVPNDFKLFKCDEKLKENGVDWIRNYYSKLKEYAQKNDFSSFTKLVEDVFLLSEKESLAMSRLIEKAGLLKDVTDASGIQDL